MHDALLSRTDREEALSRAYVQAITAATGYVVSTMDFDRDGVDVQIHAGGSMRPCLGIQLKATVNLEEALPGHLSFPLKRRNYDLLREATLVPRILVVLHLPKDEEEWVTLTADELVMRRCAYWMSLKGKPETSNTASVTVSIDQANRFDVNTLRALMEQARTGTVA